MLLVVGVCLFDKRPKVRAMVHLSCVSKFVDENIVDQLKRELHQGDIETDSSIGAATPPSAPRMRETDLAIAKSILFSQVG